MLARAVNCARGRWETFWSGDSYNAVDLLEEGDVLDKLVYTLANPVNAGLVGRAHAWEGASSLSLCFGGRRLVQRPSVFFRDRMPELAVLELRVPPALGHLSGSQLQVEIVRRLAVIEAERRAQGDKPLGMRGVLAVHWADSPTTPAPRRELNPRFAAKCTATRVAAIAGFKRWVDAYRSARGRFVAGERDVVWPLGTYAMFRRLGCPVAA
ncbi:MAG: hypothetical protein KC431_13660 [Myxococcales bacterium]|nr:hypothetical protein [Myxococcales bacterium]